MKSQDQGYDADRVNEEERCMILKKSKVMGKQKRQCDRGREKEKNVCEWGIQWSVTVLKKIQQYILIEQNSESND